MHTRLRARRVTVAAIATLALLPLAACGADDPEGSDGAGTSAGADLDGSITVLAAASLTGTFTELAEQFEAENDGVEIDLVFDSSGTLADNAAQGAPGDLLATADLGSMERSEPVQASDPEVFATNTLVLVTPAENPAGITTLADLDDDAVTYVVCVETAPCGTLAAEVLDDADIDNEPSSLERDVKATLARVVEDEADAGLVYRTDALAAADDVTLVELDDDVADDAVTEYPIVTLDQSENPDLAQAFLDYVLSSTGQDVLTTAGFGTP
ncbi:molybdate ABC transporter substrate-binding protein [Nocardioides alkalitolerans]|uniref:molybdate ABC transporter substrate-binding protein n=1 Tax=Nocardioides alkalitolerans TaxID=281714 RepID=UPI0004282ACA|nr:molybdate ABC transporter substrate-binding protein [Nocardioides alkalitolerans]